MAKPDSKAYSKGFARLLWAAACRAMPPDTRPVAPGPLTISCSRVIGELPWFLLDPLEPGYGFARRHFQQLVERLTNLQRKLFGNPRGDGVSRLPALFPDDSPQHRLGREQSSFSFEILPCSGEQGGSLFQPARLFVEELLQASLLARVEAPQPEILSDSDLVSGDRCQDA